MHPRLENSGAAEFDPRKLEVWNSFQGKQTSGTIGERTYQMLKKADALERCLGLRDLEVIQKRGIVFYRKYFGGKAVFGWRSVVRDRLDYLFVPYLFEFGDGVKVHWYWLDFAWEGATLLVLPKS